MELQVLNSTFSPRISLSIWRTSEKAQKGLDTTEVDYAN